MNNREFKIKSKQLNRLRNQAKDVGVQFGLHSEQFKKLINAIHAITLELKEHERR